MKRRLKEGYWKKFIASFIMTLVVSYFISSLLRVVLTQTGLQDNILDFKGTFTFVQSTDLQNQVVVLILSALFLVFMVSKMGLFENKYIDASSFGVHGTSRWGIFSEIINDKAMSKNNKFSPKNPLKSLEIEKGIIAGKVPSKNELLIIPKDTVVDNRNVLVIGSSGSGKGQSFVFPNMINNQDESIIVIDPKGEIYDNTHQIKQDQGYKVYRIDFINFTGDGYNPLDYVTDDQTAQALGKIIASNSSKDGKEDFFHMQAQNLLTGLIILCKSQNNKASMNHVIRMFNRISEDENYLNLLTDSIGESHPAYQILKNASVAEGKTRSSILASMAQQIAIFTLQKVQKMVDKSDFNFSEFQDHKSVLYVKIPMEDNPFVPLTATFFDQLISVFYSIADRHHNVLPKPVILLLDEFANIGKIEKYPKVLSTCRSMGMSCNTVIQDLGQFEATYGKELARTVINNHDTKLFLRTKDTETAKYFSQMAGETTVKMETKSNSQQGGLFSTKSSASKSSSEQYVKRPLITEGELMNMDRNTCYLFVEGFFPLKAEKAWQFVVYGDFMKNYPTYRKKMIIHSTSTKTANLPTGKKDENVTQVATGGVEQEVASSQEIEAKPESNNVQKNVDLSKQTETVNANKDKFLELVNEYLNAHSQVQVQTTQEFVNNEHVISSILSDVLGNEEALSVQNESDELSLILSSLKQVSQQANESIAKIERDIFIQNNIDSLETILISNIDVSEELNEDAEIMA